MQVILNLTPASNTDGPEKHAFTKDRITIGRDPTCDLVLPDTKRIVSKEHAAIDRTEDGFEVVDLGSKNFTYLNGIRLASGSPQVLSAGDVIRIGEFEISFDVEEVEEPAPVDRDDRTVFLVNPFDAPAAQLAAILEKFETAYENEVPGRREEALRMALRLVSDDRRDGLRLVADAVLGDERTVPPSQEAAHSAPPMPSPTPAPRPRNSPARPDPVPSRPKGGSAYDRVFDILIQMVPRLLGVPWRFRHEFIGQTIMHSPDAAALFEGDADDARRYLLDPNLAEEESERRALLLKDAADDLLMHALAMVDGYKGSVQQGMSRMLEEIDPEKIEQELRERGSKLDTLPILKDLKVARMVREKIETLRRDDWTVAERRVYRPAFIKAYLARMTSRRRPGE